MLGNLVNTSGIVVGSLIGLVFNGVISERYENHIMKALGLGVLVIGIQGSIKVVNPLVMLISLALGAVIGEWIDIQNWLDSLSVRIKYRFKIKSDNFVSAFVTATILFCTGSMGVVGALESGLHDDHSILFAKAVLDFISSAILTSTLGIGVIFSAASTFVYQGLIVLASQVLAPLLTDAVIIDISAVGSVLILGLGLNVLEITKLKIANYLPAILLAPCIAAFLGLVL